MIQAVTVTTAKGESLRMELTNPWESGIVIIDIDGIGQANAQINSTDMATGDGAFYNSARAQTRSITFNLKPLKNPSVEVNRHKLYHYFQVKKQVTLLFETDTRKSEIVGYVESCEPSIFSSDETVQIGVLCLDPFFYAERGTATVFSGVKPLFEFPFADDSLTPVGEETDYNTNLLYNFDFQHNPENYSKLSNPNLIKKPILRTYEGEVATTYKADDWCIINLNNGHGTATLQPDGMRIERPASDQTGNTYFLYTHPTAGFVNGNYTFSILSKEDGLVTTTANIVLGDASAAFGLKMFATGKYIAWYYNKDGARLECQIYLLSGYSITITEAKFESGTMSTIIGTEVQTNWHDKGQTLRGWEVYSGDYGLFMIDLVDGSGLKMTDYAQNTTDFQWGQQFNLERGQTVTMSILLDSGLKTSTFDIPFSGSFRSEHLDLGNNFYAELDIDGDSDRAKLYLVHPHGLITVNSDQILVKGCKIEYGSRSTLAQDGNVIPKPSEYLAGSATIEFGEILLDTRAILRYDGDADTGVTITIHAMAGAEDITLENIDTGETMFIDTAKAAKIVGGSFGTGDDIIICTIRGHRSIQFHRSGVYTNIFSAIGKDSDWFQLTTGDNLFRFSARTGEENLSVTFDYRVAYGGV